MKYLYIIRHAKAEQHVIGKEDHDRNLLNKGRKRALKLKLKNFFVLHLIELFKLLK